MVLNDVLHVALGEYAEQGFTLTTPDDHFVDLSYRGEVIAHFTQNATYDTIQCACWLYLKEKGEQMENTTTENKDTKKGICPVCGLDWAVAKEQGYIAQLRHCEIVCSKKQVAK